MVSIETKIPALAEKETSQQASNLKNALLNQLPQELRSKWGNGNIQEIQSVINERKDLGYETLIGYHCSNADLKVGDFIKPGDDNIVHYATDIKKLYGKRGKFLYLLEGSNQDRDSDKDLNWKTSFSRMKIIDKIPLTHEKVEELDVGFAEHSYS